MDQVDQVHQAHQGYHIHPVHPFVRYPFHRAVRGDLLDHGDPVDLDVHLHQGYRLHPCNLLVLLDLVHQLDLFSVSRSNFTDDPNSDGKIFTEIIGGLGVNLKLLNHTFLVDQ